jgi:diguanylate cyclase (GGDEF)-like protein
VRESLNRQVAPTRPSGPAVAALVIGIGVIAGFELVRRERLSAALAVGLTLAVWAALATFLLGRQLQIANARSLRDPLTGLPNRALLHDRIEQALARSHRTQEPFALLVVDLDGFKGVNDVRGHEAGNHVLRTIARRLETVVRATDTVARVGGDEFVVLSLGTASDDEAGALVGRMRQALKRPYAVDGGHVEIDASIGWALFPQDGLEPIDLLARADGQMYATKRDTSQESAVPHRTVDRGVIRDLESALERGQVVVHYQPIVDLNSGGVHAAEALVRRAHPDRLVSPSEFMPHVEQTPLVRSLTLAVAADALRRLEEWDADGHHLEVAVNVPYRMVDDPELVNGLAALLDSSNVESRRLTLEIVPSGPGAGSELDRLVVRRLRNLGVRLSLDDLGRASSVAAIRTLPLDQVKIDAMFLHDVGRGGRSDAIVRGFVELAHRLGLETVAEGVESRIAWEAAAALGCDFAQGFYLGHPMPAGRLVEWLHGTWPVVPTA